jgi:hypothetical protein
MDLIVVGWSGSTGLSAGWLSEQGNLVLHSVIEQSDGRLYYVTNHSIRA